jgi:acyl carrier protein phosphodiesterase
MNYLAHAFLGQKHELELVGQLIADEIKGKSYLNLPLEIQIGIRMHRWVDQTTDQSPHLTQAKILLQPTLGRLAGIALDIIMDHYLSIHWLNYNSNTLDIFIGQIYETLERHRAYWINTGGLRISKMIEQDWLNRYKSLSGIALTMNEMAKRKPMLSPLQHSLQLIEKHYITFENAFHLLIHELIVGYKSKINTFATLPPECRYKDGQAK